MEAGCYDQIGIFYVAGWSGWRQGNQLGGCCGGPGGKRMVGWPQVVAVWSENRGWTPEIDGL